MFVFKIAKENNFLQTFPTVLFIFPFFFLNCTPFNVYEAMHPSALPLQMWQNEQLFSLIKKKKKLKKGEKK